MALIPLILMLSIGIWIFHPAFQQPKSDSFLQRASNQAWHELIPNLQQAKIYVPLPTLKDILLALLNKEISNYH